jgi:DNA polymerase-4
MHFAARRPVCERTFVRSEATILHADLDAFYASVEQRDDPRLRGRPVIVGPGVVLAASYEARAYGVRSAMGAAQARRRCPRAIVVEARWEAYLDASKVVFEVFAQTAPVVEKLSIDEAFLDVAGLRRFAGSPTDIAARLRREVREKAGLPITVGVATTRLLAKVASGVAKPDGLLVVPPGGELAFLHPLRVERLWGVGPATAAKLYDRGVTTVGEAAQLGEPALVEILGRASGRRLHALAHNRDPRPVRMRRGRRSFGSQSAFNWSSRSHAALDARVVALVDRVTRRMRTAGRVGRTVVLRLRFDDFTRASRSRTLSRPTAATEPILITVRELLEAAMPMIRRQGLTLVGVTVQNLDGDGAAVQLELPFDGPGRSALDAVLDDVRDRYGSDAVTRAALLGGDPGLSASLLPE